MEQAAIFSGLRNRLLQFYGEAVIALVVAIQSTVQRLVRMYGAP